MPNKLDLNNIDIDEIDYDVPKKGKSIKKFKRLDTDTKDNKYKLNKKLYK